MHPEAQAYFANATRWPRELTALRRLLVDAGLTEDNKWRQPCYTVDGRNVAILGQLKRGCTLTCFRGAELPDPAGLLRAAGPNSRGGGAHETAGFPGGCHAATDRMRHGPLCEPGTRVRAPLRTLPVTST